MTRNLILKPTLIIFWNFKTYPKKGIAEGGRQEIQTSLSFPYLFLAGVDSHVKVTGGKRTLVRGRNDLLGNSYLYGNT